MSYSNQINVLVVDDSAIVRKYLTHVLNQDPRINVVATAPDPYLAREKLVQHRVDVMTLDIEMPKMDGISFLQKVMQHKPTPTVIVSSLSPKGSVMYLKALESGALAVIQKPALKIAENLLHSAKEIIDTVVVASKSKNILIPLNKKIAAINSTALEKTTEQIVVIASSTGGTVALQKILPALPVNIPGIVIVQHFPPIFSQSFSHSLDRLCEFQVEEAKDGDRITPGRALIVPGNYHARIVRSGARYHISLNSEPMVHGVRPAADVLFDSVAKYVGGNAIGLILTGMGRDGAKGLKKMRDAGSYNIAQSEKTSVVFGMPKEAIAAGGIDKVVDLEKIPSEIVFQLNKRSQIN